MSVFTFVDVSDPWEKGTVQLIYDTEMIPIFSLAKAMKYTTTKLKTLCAENFIRDDAIDANIRFYIRFSYLAPLLKNCGWSDEKIKKGIEQLHIQPKKRRKTEVRDLIGPEAEKEFFATKECKRKMELLVEDVVKKSEEEIKLKVEQFLEVRLAIELKMQDLANGLERARAEFIEKIK